MRKIFYYPVVAGSVLLLCGCTTLELVSFGATGISYVMTGKSLSDHTISGVMEQDCALHRWVVGDSMCVEYDNSDTLRSKNKIENKGYRLARQNEGYWQNLPPINRPVQTTPQNQPKLAPLPSATNPDEVVKALMAEQELAKNKPLKQPLKRQAEQPVNVQPNNVEVGVAQPMMVNFKMPTHNDEPQLFAVLGSYNEFRFAEESLAKFNGLNPIIIDNPARKHDKTATLYRVVAGPMSEADFSNKLSPELNAWRIRLCADSMGPPPCTVQILAKKL